MLRIGDLRARGGRRSGRGRNRRGRLAREALCLRRSRPARERDPRAGRQGEGRVMSGAEDALTRAEELLDRLERTRERLEATAGPGSGDRHPRRARRDREAGRDRARAGAARGRWVVCAAWTSTARSSRTTSRSFRFASELGALTEAMRYSLDGRRQADPARALPRVRRGDRVAAGGAPARCGGRRARPHLRHGSRRPARPRRRRDPARPCDLPRRSSTRRRRS